MACPDALSRPQPIVAGVLLAAAVAETMVDYDYDKSSITQSRNRYARWNWQKDRGVWISVGLMLFHVGVLGMGRAQLMGWNASLAERTNALWKWTCCVPLTEKMPPPTF